MRLVSPDASSYVWNQQLHTLESISYGCPANPKAGPAVAHPLNKLKFINAGIDFEKEGLRARLVLEKEQK